MIYYITSGGGITVRNKQILIRLTDSEMEKLLELTNRYHFQSVSSYLRYVGLNAIVKVIVTNGEEVESERDRDIT